MKYLITALLVITTLFARAQTCPTGLSGTYFIGPGGNFASITAAISSLTSNGMNGSVVLELKSNYNSSSETFPIRFQDISCLSPTRTLTLRPEIGATNLIINGANTTSNGSTIDLSNSRHVVIDGRPGGSGTSIQLTITNSSGIGSTIRFSQDASHNVLHYLNIQGSSNLETSGVIGFFTSTLNVTSGNSSNLISHCNIGKSSGAFPRNLVYSRGSSGKKNAGNKILNCNLSDYKSISGSSNGVLLEANSTDWEINGNSFFHSASLNIAVINTAIEINDSTSSGFLILNNFIGGSAPFCGGEKVSFTSGTKGISIFANTERFSSIQNNTIQNILFKPHFLRFYGIYMRGGKIDCGSVAGNVIGSTSEYGNIIYNLTNSNNASITGIGLGTEGFVGKFDTVLIINNRIGGIKRVLEVINSNYNEIHGIDMRLNGSGHFDISNNVIGSEDVRASIDMGPADPNGRIFGIRSYAELSNVDFPGSSVQTVVKGNLFSNLTGNTIAIELWGGKNIIEKNVIKDIYTDYLTSYYPEIVGIRILQAGKGNRITENQLINFNTRGPSHTGTIIGIHSLHPRESYIDRNLLHSFQMDGAGDITGIHAAGNVIGESKSTITNNMIRLNVDTAGNPMNKEANLVGILTFADSSTISHNTVYIGGSGDGGSVCLSLRSINPARPSRITNNIFINLKTTSPLWYRSVIIEINEDLINLNGVDLHHNLYQFSGSSGSYIGSYKYQRYSTLNAWQTASGKDTASFLADPLLKQKNGTVNTVDLHLSGGSPAESAGYIEPDILYDFDGDVRSAASPADIGADGGDFACVTIITPSIQISYSGCATGNLQFVASSNIPSGAIIQWYVNNVLSGTGNSLFLNGAANGAQVYARLFVSGSCFNPSTVVSNTITINCVTTSIPLIEGLDFAEVGPNPSTGTFYLNYKLNVIRTVEIEAWDLNGRKIYNIEPQLLSGQQTKLINLSGQSAGIYYLVLKIGNEKRLFKLVIH